MLRAARKPVKILLNVAVIASLLLGARLYFPLKADGAQIQLRSVMLSNNVPDETSNYNISMTIPTAGTLGSIKAEFCNNTALFIEACIAPPGFDVSHATLTAQSGETGFTISPDTTSNILILTRTSTTNAANMPISYTLSNVTNATGLSSEYIRYSTFATDDASGSETDRGSVAYALNPRFSVNTEVPPRLDFCVGVTIQGTDCTTAEGNYVNMGEFKTTNASTGQTQIVGGTNASGGYTVTIDGRTLASGNNVLPALSARTSSAPGTNQFGINLRANSNPAAGADPAGNGNGAPKSAYNVPNQFYFRPGDIIASTVGSDDYRKYTVTYLVNINRTQPAGVYSSTFTYIGLGNF